MTEGRRSVSLRLARDRHQTFKHSGIRLVGVKGQQYSYTRDSGASLAGQCRSKRQEWKGRAMERRYGPTPGPRASSSEQSA